MKPSGDGQNLVSYTASYYANDKEAHFFHSEYKTSEPVSAGIYTRMDDFNSFEDLENHSASLRGILAKGDVRDILPKLKDGTFDLLVTDPPYKVISGGSGGKGAPRGMLSRNDGKIFEHNDIEFSEWLPEAYRLLKDGSQAYIFTNFLNLKSLMSEAKNVGFKVHNLLVWEKNTATPNRWYMKNCEYVLFLRKGPARSIKNAGSKTVSRFNNIVGTKIHETEKPVDLLRMYIQNSTTGGWVLDPFAGSGSTLEASLLEKVRCFTIEVDEKYISPILKRTNKLLMQGT